MAAHKLEEKTLDETAETAFILFYWQKPWRPLVTNKIQKKK